MLTAQVVDKVAEAAVPALGVLEKSVIGALLILSWAISVVCVWQLIKVQNARVIDQKESSLKAENLVVKLTTAFSEMKGALDGLKKAEENGQLVIQSVKQSFDLFLLSQSRRFSPPHGVVAVRPPEGGR